MDNRPPILEFIARQVLVFDGATGTNLQDARLTADDFEGREGCNEVLVRSRPDVVRALHESFLRAGCHVVETDTFGANRLVLAEYDLAEQARQLNRRGAALAREVALDFSSAGRPRYVAGSMGPGTKLPSLGHVSFDELVSAYREQAAGLLEGGVDLLAVETCQDILQTRAALLAAKRELQRLDRRAALMVSLTLEASGTLLLGTELAAALATLAPLRPDILGLNCATGPLEMKQHIRLLSRHSPFVISAMPNAGLPENIRGRTVYPLRPEELADWQEGFVLEDGVRVVGGCCGTTPEHIAALVRRVDGLEPGRREPRAEPSISSLYSGVTLAQEPRPLLIGERTNANGSRRFRELLLADDFDGMVALARDQERGGAHALDLCTAYVGRDEKRDMTEAVARFSRQVRLPLVIDSTQHEVMEAALKLCGGRCVLNSINLEDGEAKARAVLELARDFGAAVIALAIDEEGMARTAARKLAVAERLVRLAVEEFGLAPEDLLLDMLTFTVASGDETLRDAAAQTLEAIRQVKRRFPGVQTVLGVSNISFGLKPRARRCLNSVFLHLAVEAGLDAAIVDAGKIVPLARLGELERRLCQDLLLNRWEAPDADPLFAYIRHHEQVRGDGALQEAEEDTATLHERITRMVVDGDQSDLPLLLASALTQKSPLAIINELLIPAMKTVGKLFVAGQMQLPFVLQSAEVMKQAVAYLEPLLEREEGSAAHAGTLVLATVKGDVHDIGKNLVDILLSNNGYRVINLGIKVPVEEMIRVYRAENADAIGMSGLLVKSTLVMRENLEELRRRGHNPHVLLGGAALTRRYVEEDLRGVYGPRVHYGKDAFSGLELMRAVMAGAAAGADASSGESAPANVQDALDGELDRALSFEHPPEGIAPAEVPVPPFWGRRVVELSLEEVFGLINETVLFRGRWQYRRGRLAAEEFQRILSEEVRPELSRLKAEVAAEGLFAPRAVYGYWPCRGQGNELAILAPGTGQELCRMRFPRQRKAPFHCIADYFHGAGPGGNDLFGALVVTVGQRATDRTAELFAGHRYRDYLHLHGLAVEAADAAAELLHRNMRRELGIDGQDAHSPEGLFQQQYRGSRYSFGYPACPVLEDQQKLFSLLDPEEIGVSLTESSQMVPEQSVSAFVAHHPAARYFR